LSDGLCRKRQQGHCLWLWPNRTLRHAVPSTKGAPPPTGPTGTAGARLRQTPPRFHGASHWPYGGCLSCTTFDMRGPTRLAGAGPLDGRVRRRSMHSLGPNFDALGTACNNSLVSSERQRAPRMRASQGTKALNGAKRQRAWPDERPRIQAIQSSGRERSGLAWPGTALNCIGFKDSEPCAGRQRTDSPHKPFVCTKRKAPTAAIRVRDLDGRSRHTTLATPNV
jgi:hypothetical protein